MYDFIIRNGTVIDPVSGTQEVRDLFIRQGRLVAPEPEEPRESPREIDASGCYVSGPASSTPTSTCMTGGASWGGKADLVCPSNCVTTAI